MKNDTNLTKYKFLAPIYDLVFNRFLVNGRKKAFALLDFKANDDVLLIGIGTGLDLSLLPNDCYITGIDISEAMLKKARSKAETSNREVDLFSMNAENLDFENQTFDYVILSLILSVAENPQAVMLEALRVLGNQGKILVFDKFRKKEKIGTGRKLLNKVTSLIGTDITRRFEEIIAGLPVRIINDEGSLFRGNYRIILLTKEERR